MSERDFIKGQRAAYTSILNTCVRELYPDKRMEAADLLAEREEARTMLEIVAKDHNIELDCSPDLHLADIIRQLGKNF